MIAQHFKPVAREEVFMARKRGTKDKQWTPANGIVTAWTSDGCCEQEVQPTNRTVNVSRPDGSSGQEVFFIGSQVLCRDDDDMVRGDGPRRGIDIYKPFWRFGTVVTLHPTIKIRCKEIPFPNVYDHVQLAFQEQPEVPGMDLAEGWVQVMDVRHSRCYYWNKCTDEVQWDIPASEGYCDSEHLRSESASAACAREEH